MLAVSFQTRDATLVHIRLNVFTGQSKTRADCSRWILGIDRSLQALRRDRSLQLVEVGHFACRQRAEISRITESDTLLRRELRLKSDLKNFPSDGVTVRTVITVLLGLFDKRFVHDGGLRLSILSGEITDVVQDFIKVGHINSGLTASSITFTQQNEFVVIR